MIRKLLWVVAAIAGVVLVVMLVEACRTLLGFGMAAREEASAFGSARREEAG